MTDATRDTDSDAARAHPAVSLEAAIVARRYYLDDRQKSEIADELGISRFKVARLLDEARASGIVRIYVDMPADIDLPLGDQLARAFGIRRAIVVRSVDGSPEATLPLIGAAGAEYLRGVLDADDVLGVSWGRSLTSVVDVVSELPAIDTVQLVGGVGAGQMDVSGVELLRRLASVSGGRAFPLYAPLFVGTPEMAKALRLDPALGATTDLFARLTIALVGIGSWRPPSSALFSEFTAAERDELLARGATADVCTFVFDADGAFIDTAAHARAVGITLDEFRAIPEVIGVAGGREKADAIAAVLRSGVISTLVTDSETARRVLDSLA